MRRKKLIETLAVCFCLAAGVSVFSIFAAFVVAFVGAFIIWR